MKSPSTILCTIILCLAMFPAFASAAVEVYFLRHAEVNMSDSDKPLVEAGKNRAAALAEYFASVQITHIYVTNYQRNLDTSEPLAMAKSLEVVQMPRIGSTVDGKKVTNRSKGNVAIKPILEALEGLPDNSVAVVIANSGNLFPIMSKFGVTQLPCTSKKCFPTEEFNNIWVVNKSSEGTTLRTEKYGN